MFFSINHKSSIILYGQISSLEPVQSTEKLDFDLVCIVGKQWVKSVFRVHVLGYNHMKNCNDVSQ